MKLECSEQQTIYDAYALPAWRYAMHWSVTLLHGDLLTNTVLYNKSSNDNIYSIHLIKITYVDHGQLTPKLLNGDVYVSSQQATYIAM